jgi:hypothetical protein
LLQELNRIKNPAAIFSDTRMRRYFFHVVGGDDIFKDKNGRRFDTLADASAHATTIAAELAQDGDHYRGFAVSVTDEEDHELARVPV